MNTTAAKKYSLLGLILVTASAITGAMLPSKGKKNLKSKIRFGMLIASTGGFADPHNGNTCIKASHGVACDYTVTGNNSGQSSTSATSSDRPNDTTSNTNNAGNATGTNTTEF